MSERVSEWIKFEFGLKICRNPVEICWYGDENGSGDSDSKNSHFSACNFCSSMRFYWNNSTFHPQRKKWKHFCASKKRTTFFSHSSYATHPWAYVCCFSSLVSSQILWTIKSEPCNKKAFRLILSILSSYSFFQTVSTFNKRENVFSPLWKESMQIFPLNSFIMYADFFFSLYFLYCACKFE